MPRQRRRGTPSEARTATSVMPYLPSWRTGSQARGRRGDRANFTASVKEWERRQLGGGERNFAAGETFASRSVLDSCLFNPPERERYRKYSLRIARNLLPHSVVRSLANSWRRKRDDRLPPHVTQLADRQNHLKGHQCLSRRRTLRRETRLQAKRDLSVKSTGGCIHACAGKHLDSLPSAGHDTLSSGAGNGKSCPRPYDGIPSDP